MRLPTTFPRLRLWLLAAALSQPLLLPAQSSPSLTRASESFQKSTEELRDSARSFYSSSQADKVSPGEKNSVLSSIGSLKDGADGLRQLCRDGKSANKISDQAAKIPDRLGRVLDALNSSNSNGAMQQWARSSAEGFRRFEGELDDLQRSAEQQQRPSGGGYVNGGGYDGGGYRDDSGSDRLNRRAADLAISALADRYGYSPRDITPRRITPRPDSIDVIADAGRRSFLVRVDPRRDRVLAIESLSGDDSYPGADPAPRPSRRDLAVESATRYLSRQYEIPRRDLSLRSVTEVRSGLEVILLDTDRRAAYAVTVDPDSGSVLRARPVDLGQRDDRDGRDNGGATDPGQTAARIALRYLARKYSYSADSMQITKLRPVSGGQWQVAVNTPGNLAFLLLVEPASGQVIGENRLRQ